MTKGKNALSDIPRNHLMANSPEKFVTAAVRSVMDPKTTIIAGRTRDGPNFLPSNPKTGAVKTYGMKKT